MLWMTVPIAMQLTTSHGHVSAILFSRGVGISSYDDKRCLTYSISGIFLIVID